jgi:hypothetical protein
VTGVGVKGRSYRGGSVELTVEVGAGEPDVNGRFRL